MVVEEGGGGREMGEMGEMGEVEELRDVVDEQAKKIETLEQRLNDVTRF